MTPFDTRVIAARKAVLVVLERDPLKPVVSAATVTELARLQAASEAREDSDVLAERAACVEAFAHAAKGVGAALRDAGIDNTGLELAEHRFGAAIEAIGQGLHRTGEPG